MKLDTMRWIDRCIGVPLCAAASAYLRAWWSIRPLPPRPLQRVLFIELSEMGSTVLAQPAIRKIRSQANAQPYFVIFARNAASLDLFDSIPRQNIFTIRDDSLWKLASDTIRFFIWARQNAIDTVIDLELFSRYTALLTGLSGSNRRAGFYRFHNEGLYRGEMLTHRVAYNPHIHIAKNFIAQVDALLSPEPTIPYTKTLIKDAELELVIDRPSIAVTDAVTNKLRVLVPGYEPSRQRLVLINPGGNEFLPQRRWMPERFAELGRRIIAAYADALVLITGAKNEIEHAKSLAAMVNHSQCVVFAGHSTIAELPALYGLASVIVTSDSGPGHFAAVCGLPTVVLFGPETPALYKPLGRAHVIYAGLACSPCVNAQNHRRTACTDNVCMQAISVDEVFAAVAKIFAA